MSSTVVTCKKHDLLTLRVHLSSPPFFLLGFVLLISVVFCVVFFVGVCVAHLCSFLCGVCDDFKIRIDWVRIYFQLFYLRLL
jgi:hypothetical protein